MVYFYIDPATHFMDFFIHILVYLCIGHTLKKKKQIFASTRTG